MVIRFLKFVIDAMLFPASIAPTKSVIFIAIAKKQGRQARKHISSDMEAVII